MEYPTLEAVTEQLQSVSGVDKIDPDRSLLEIDDLDSLDLMEWLYGFQEKYPQIGADESLFEDIDDSVTLRAIYDQIIANATSVATPGA
jgi:acyl carrier protein